VGSEFCLKVGNSCKYMKLLSSYIIAIMCRVRPQGQGVPEITTLQGGGTKGGYFGNTPALKGPALHKKVMPACDGCGIMHANHASTYTPFWAGSYYQCWAVFIFFRES
jgi:hypothetical protein